MKLLSSQIDNNDQYQLSKIRISKTQKPQTNKHENPQITQKIIKPSIIITVMNTKSSLKSKLFTISIKI